MCNGGHKKMLAKFMSYKSQDAPLSREAIHSLLQDCACDVSIRCVRAALNVLTNSGLTEAAYICDNLIRIFAKHDCLLEAHQLFCKVSQPTVYTWHAIISAHTKVGQGEHGIELYLKMQQEGVKPDRFVFMSVLKICANEKGVTEGRLIHDAIMRSGHESGTSIQNTFVDMYSKCGSLYEARCAFDRLQERNIVSWGAMIAGYAAHGAGVEALKMFSDLCREGAITPNDVIFLGAFKACGSIEALKEGRLLHKMIITYEILFDEVVSSSIVDMYLKCGSLDDANIIFACLPNKDMVSWGAMILGYADQGYGGMALSLYSDMLSKGVYPSKLTFLGVLKACWIIRRLDQGRVLHAAVIKHNFESDLIVANALIDMYAKCGSIGDACSIFDGLSSKDAVSYNSMIQGYVEQELGLQALDLYSSMRQGRIQPSKITFPAILKACSSVKALVEGREIHNDVIARDLDSDMMIQTTLVDMYAKCGSMEEACKVFKAMGKRDVASWGSIFGGYAQSGEWELARHYFSKMRRYNLKPDEWIFTSILAACSHAGEVDEGKWYFKSMVHEHGVKPTADHLNCIIDLFGRAGRLDEAVDMFQSMPQHLDDNGWTAILTSCRMYGHREIGDACFCESKV